jgi:hypothetical protein
LPSTISIDPARVTPKRPGSKTPQSLLHTPRCVSLPRRASQTDLSWFFPSILHPNSASASSGFLTSHFYLVLSLSSASTSLLFFFFLLLTSNSYSQTTAQHHLLLHSLALTSAHSLASVLAPDSSFLLLLHFHRHHLQPCRSSHCSSSATVSIARPASCKVSFLQISDSRVPTTDCTRRCHLICRAHTSRVTLLTCFRQQYRPTKVSEAQLHAFHQLASKVS